MMTKAPFLLLAMIVAAAPRAVAESRHDGTPPARPVTTTQSDGVDDPLKLQWFSHAMESFLTGRPEPEQPQETHPAR